MKFNLFFLSAALSAFALVAGAPAASENAHVSVTTASEADITAYLSGVTELEAPKEVALEKRQSLSLVYYCQNAPWVQPCYTAWGYQGVCYPLPRDWNDKISSVGPNQGFQCWFYHDINCQGAYLNTRYPGISDLSTYGGGYHNDKFSSFRCSRI